MDWSFKNVIASVVPFPGPDFQTSPTYRVNITVPRIHSGHSGKLWDFDEHMFLDTTRSHPTGSGIVGIKWDQTGDFLATFDTAGRIGIWAADSCIDKWDMVQSVALDDCVVGFTWFPKAPQSYLRSDSPYSPPRAAVDIETVDLTSDSEDDIGKSKGGTSEPLVTEEFKGLTVTNNSMAFIAVGEGGRNYTFSQAFTQLPEFDMLDRKQETPKISAASIAFPVANQMTVAICSNKFGAKVYVHSANVNGANGIKWRSSQEIQIDPTMEIISNVLFIESTKLATVGMAVEGKPDKAVTSQLFLHDLNSTTQAWSQVTSKSFAVPIRSLAAVPVFTHPNLRNLLMLVLADNTKVVLGSNSFSEMPLEFYWGVNTALPKHGPSPPILAFAISPNRVGFCSLLQNLTLEEESINFTSLPNDLALIFVADYVRYLREYQVQYALTTLRFQIRAAIDLLVSSFRSTSMVKGLLENLIPKTKAELDGQNISESMFLNLRTLHHIAPLMLWTHELMILLLRQLFIYFNTQRPPERPEPLKPDEPNVLKENFDTLSSPSLVSLIFHQATRRSLVEIIFINKFIRNNISLIRVAGQRAHDKLEGQALSLRSTALALISPATALGTDEVVYITMLDQNLQRSKLRLEIVGHIFVESSNIIDSFKPTPAEEEEIFLTGVVPKRFESTFKPMQAIFAKYGPQLFTTGELKHHGNTPTGPKGPPIPLGPLVGLVPLFFPLSSDFRSLSTIQEVRPSGEPEHAVTEEQFIERIASIAKGRTDIVTKANLAAPNVILRQCSRCGHFSSVPRKDVVKKELVAPELFQKFKGEQPWKDRFVRYCLCGGSWRFAAKSF
ncbi:hypothetical protein HDU97_007510 [Phlyctochytrium planicorne]|nr:hypothetical protein HDU97_007510 [Phlyctochytrium planicorne]